MSRQEAGRGRASGLSDAEDDQGFFRIMRVFSGVGFSIGGFFIAILITACVVILVLSKHEKPRVPLRAFIVGQLCVYSLYLILLFLNYLSQRQIMTHMSDQIASESATFDSFPTCFAIVQGLSGCIQGALGCFSLAWLIVGCVWVSMAFSTRSDNLILFWGSMGFIIFAASGVALAVIVTAVACCCIPIGMCIMACFS